MREIGALDEREQVGRLQVAFRTEHAETRTADLVIEFRRYQSHRVEIGPGGRDNDIVGADYLARATWSFFPSRERGITIRFASLSTLEMST